jgi:hypothetical protein
MTPPATSPSSDAGNSSLSGNLPLLRFGTGAPAYVRKRALFRRVLIPNACALTGTEFRERLGMPNIRADDRHGAPLQRVLNFVGDLLEIYSSRYRATVPYSPAIPSQASVHLHGQPPTRRRKRVVRSQSNCDGHHENVDLGTAGEPVHRGGESGDAKCGRTSVG